MIFDATPAGDPLNVESILRSAFNVNAAGALALEEPCVECDASIDFAIPSMLGRIDCVLDCPWCGAENHRLVDG